MNARHNFLIHSGLSEKAPTPIGYVTFSDKTTVNQNLAPGKHVQLRFLGSRIERLKKRNEIEFTSRKDDCLELMSHQKSSSALNLRYLNRCPWHVNANICIVFSNGKSKLKSVFRIPKGGSLSQKIFHRSTNSPIKVETISSPGVPPVPPSCEGLGNGQQ